MAAGVNNEVGGFPELASLLWRERANRERVLYRIVQEQLVLAAGRTRWLARAGQEIEEALSDLRHGESVRAAIARALAARLGLPADVPLVQLADSAPGPWDEILRGLGDALRDLGILLDEATSESRRLLDAVTSVREPWPWLARLRNTSFTPLIS